MLNLSGNFISNIKFENLDCEELKYFDLRYNRLSEINIISKVKFKKLKIYYLMLME